ncbi:TerB family tellurite resistance protein [Alphaproteobacteria bacterium]|nr:TerB family tellurite resistance protein [Alphaproteobacteria bacterium]MDA8642626.1 TerB family tellurite resistance protein [Alphaproteobacteria bacterium]MDA8666478.1 TerB family tellurite resistance protein [Alphaproteobacteria bacterium]MDA8726054.1 TerB family tellurite resistance protein [Alphaproteobacteria bacterium]MDB2381432.1 TerB family tellurite resistance protein [Alphaproteobacteria bacterium]
MPMDFNAALAAGIVVVLGLVFVLLRRRATRAKETVFEKVEKAHKQDRLGQFVKAREDSFLNIVYGLAAAMVVADGEIDKNEIEMAETLGARLIPNFDNEAFLKVVRGHAQLPRFNDMVDAVAPLLPMEAKVEIFDYLQAIATSDGQLSPDERHFIHHVEMRFGLDKLQK